MQVLLVILMKNAWFVLFLVLIACSPEEIVSSDVAQADREVQGDGELASGSDWSGMIMSGAKCVSVQDGQTATVYFKGGRMRMDTLPADAHAIYDDEMIYAWTGQTGSKMSRKDLEKLQGMASQQSFKSQEDVSAEMQRPGVDCKPASVSADVFVPPSSVQFMDLGEAIKGQLGMPLPQ